MKHKTYRAGVIPFVIDENGEPLMMFMRPSDGRYGGDDWQIAKGRVEDGDDAHQTAFREGAEELGLRIDNILNYTCIGTHLGRTTVYVAHVADQYAFDQFHHETGAIEWLTLSEFEIIGRQLHLPIVQLAHTTAVQMFTHRGVAQIAVPDQY